MFWNFIIIGIVVVVLVILLRRIPLARKIQAEKEDITPEKMTHYGLMAQADDAFKKGDFTEAEELYVQAAAGDPGNIQIFNRLGAIYLEQKNFYDAKEAFRQSAKCEAENPSCYVNLGLAYMGLKDYFKAVQSFSEALKIEPKNRKYQKLLEKAEKMQGKEKK